MNEALTGILSMAFVMRDSAKSNMEEWKDRILIEWVESQKMPRKMKKKVRKSLELDWQIACYDPFEGMLNF